MKTIEQLKFFSPKDVFKFQQPLLITLGVADEKLERGQKAPPREIGLTNVCSSIPHIIHKRHLSSFKNVYDFY